MSKTLSAMQIAGLVATRDAGLEAMVSDNTGLEKLGICSQKRELVQERGEEQTAGRHRDNVPITGPMNFRTWKWEKNDQRT